MRFACSQLPPAGIEIVDGILRSLLETVRSRIPEARTANLPRATTSIPQTAEAKTAIRGMSAVSISFSANYPDKRLSPEPGMGVGHAGVYTPGVAHSRIDNPSASRGVSVCVSRKNADEILKRMDPRMAAIATVSKT